MAANVTIINTDWNFGMFDLMRVSNVTIINIALNPGMFGSDVFFVLLFSCTYIST